MTKAAIRAAIDAWQSDPQLHPLTCDADGRHGLLEAVDTGSTVLLKGPDCHRLTSIPEAVLLRAHPVPADPRR